MIEYVFEALALRFLDGGTDVNSSRNCKPLPPLTSNPFGIKAIYYPIITFLIEFHCIHETDFS